MLVFCCQKFPTVLSDCDSLCYNIYYDEYVVLIITDDDNVETKVLEKVGSWEVDLSGYAKTTYVNDELAKKVDVVEGSRLITTEEGAKLNSIKDLYEIIK